MGSQKWLYVSLLGFTLGVLWRSFFDFGLSFSVFLIGLSFVILAYHYFVQPHKIMVGNRENLQPVLLASLFIFALSLGILRFDIADLHRGSVVLDELTREHVSAEGVIIEEPDEREDNTKLTILLENVFDEEVKEKVWK